VDTGVTTTFGLIEFPVEDVWRDQLDALDDTEREGGQMFAQSHCRGIGILLSFLTTLPFDHLPEWTDIRSRPIAEQAALLRRDDVRQRLVQAATHGKYGAETGPEVGRPDYGRLHVLERAHGRNPTVLELAEARGQEPIETMLDLALRD